MLGSCCKTSSPKRKRPETPRAVEGLLTAADKISVGLPSGMRHLVAGGCLGTLLVGTQQEFGQYQGRVVLIALAVELALKFAYEQDHANESAPATHDLRKLFEKLKAKRRQTIEANYEILFQEYKHAQEEQNDNPPEEWWANIGKLLKKCKDASIDWRFIEEEGKIPTKFVMRATCLSLGAKSILEEIRTYQP